MVDAERAAPAEQMRQTALVQRVGEAAIRRPPVADQHAGEVRAQDRGRVVKAAPGANRIHGGLWCRKRPQPVQHRADAPAGFIGTDDGTPADLGTQGVVGWSGHARRAMQGVDQAAGGDPEPEAVTQQHRDLLERHADMFVQEHDEGHGAGAEVHIGGPQRVGGLQRMSTLDAAATGDTAADLHVEAPDDRPDHREVLLILGCDADDVQRAPTARAHPRERRVVGHIHTGGHRASRPTAIPDAGAPPRPPTPALRAILGERGGLTEAGAARRIELPLQSLVVPLQSIAFAFHGAVLTLRTHQLVAQVRQLLLLALDQFLTVLAGPAGVLSCHTRLMADSLEKYKYKIVSPAPLRRRTR